MSGSRPNASCSTTTPGHGPSLAGCARYARASPARVGSAMSGTGAARAALLGPERRVRDGERDGHEDDRDDEGDADAHERTLSRGRVRAPALARAARRRSAAASAAPATSII